MYSLLLLLLLNVVAVDASVNKTYLNSADFYTKIDSSYARVNLTMAMNQWIQENNITVVYLETISYPSDSIDGSTGLAMAWSELTSYSSVNYDRYSYIDYVQVFRVWYYSDSITDTFVNVNSTADPKSSGAAMIPLHLGLPIFISFAIFII